MSTPIGNLEDVSLRALRVLREAQWVLAEDTRRTRTLLAHYAIEARLRSFHAHNEAARLDEALGWLAAGMDVALVTDAGTPAVSDPGERLVAAARAAGHEVVPVPGASAVLAARVGAGLPTRAFACVGFLPRSARERRALAERYRGRDETLVAFESPRRIAASLRDVAEVLGTRRACVARELTKLHEEWRHGSLHELAASVPGDLKGELTLVVAGADESERAALDADARGEGLDEAIREGLAAGASARDVAARVAAATRVPRREVYARVIALRDGA